VRERCWPASRKP